VEIEETKSGMKVEPAPAEDKPTLKGFASGFQHYPAHTPSPHRFDFPFEIIDITDPSIPYEVLLEIHKTVK
jgi:hypothetical protein